MSNNFIFDSRKLQDPIIIEILQPIDDGAGGYEAQWHVFAQIMACITPIRIGYSQEILLAGQQEIRRMVRIICRYHLGLDYSMRINIPNSNMGRDIILGIISITTLDSRNQWQEIIASEGKEGI